MTPVYLAYISPHLPRTFPTSPHISQARTAHATSESRRAAEAAQVNPTPTLPLP